MTFLRRAVARLLWLLRPRYPLAWARPFMKRKIRRQVEDPESLGNAKLEIAHLLGPDVPDADLDRLAREYIAHWTWWTELRWHPRSISRMRVEDADLLLDAHAQGRGVMVSMVHHGHWDALFPSIQRATGLPIPVLADPKSLASGGPQMIQHLRICGSGGGLVPATVGTQGMVDVLREGGVMVSAMDLPGRTVVPFGDRRVRCSSGAVHAARATDAPLLVIVSAHDGTAPFLRLVKVTDHSAEHEPAELMERLAAIHHASLVGWPQAAYWPRALWVDAEEAGAAEPTGTGEPSTGTSRSTTAG